MKRIGTGVLSLLLGMSLSSQGLARSASSRPLGVQRTASIASVAWQSGTELNQELEAISYGTEYMMALSYTVTLPAGVSSSALLLLESDNGAKKVPYKLALPAVAGTNTYRFGYSSTNYMRGKNVFTYQLQLTTVAKGVKATTSAPMITITLTVT